MVGMMGGGVWRRCSMESAQVVGSFRRRTRSADVGARSVGGGKSDA